MFVDVVGRLAGRGIHDTPEASRKYVRSGPDPAPLLYLINDTQQLGRGKLGPGAHVAGASSVPVQMWQGQAQSRCRCGRSELSPGAVPNRLSCRRSASVFSGLVSLLLPRPHATDELAAGRLLLFSYGTRPAPALVYSRHGTHHTAAAHLQPLGCARRSSSSSAWATCLPYSVSAQSAHPRASCVPVEDSARNSASQRTRRSVTALAR